eukprot:Gb_01431 [translate_table: standard]
MSGRCESFGHEAPVEKVVVVGRLGKRLQTLKGRKEKTPEIPFKEREVKFRKEKVLLVATLFVKEPMVRKICNEATLEYVCMNCVAYDPKLVTQFIKKFKEEKNRVKGKKILFTKELVARALRLLADDQEWMNEKGRTSEFQNPTIKLVGKKALKETNSQEATSKSMERSCNCGSWRTNKEEKGDKQLLINKKKKKMAERVRSPQLAVDLAGESQFSDFVRHMLEIPSSKDIAYLKNDDEVLIKLYEVASPLDKNLLAEAFMTRAFVPDDLTFLVNMMEEYKTLLKEAPYEMRRNPRMTKELNRNNFLVAREPWRIEVYQNALHRSDRLANRIKVAGPRWIGTMYLPNSILQQFLMDIDEPSPRNGWVSLTIVRLVAWSLQLPGNHASNSLAQMEQSNGALTS